MRSFWEAMDFKVESGLTKWVEEGGGEGLICESASLASSIHCREHVPEELKLKTPTILLEQVIQFDLEFQQKLRQEPDCVRLRDREICYVSVLGLRNPPFSLITIGYHSGARCCGYEHSRVRWPLHHIRVTGGLHSFTRLPSGNRLRDVADLLLTRIFAGRQTN
ncbi:hypothetical protein J6590_018589 [Homalodisca vitripennis]|nr:hypothetical protein J6590_018589 [Homalodisca vitripennis]